MAKFDLKTAQMQKKQDFETVVTGTHSARIIHLVDVGDYAFSSDSQAKPSTALTFQLSSGALISKIISNSAHEQSTMMLIVGCVEDTEDLTDLLGKKLVLDVEANGAWPKITGYSSLEYYDEFQDIKFPETPLVLLLPEGNAESVDVKENIVAIQTLPPEIKKVLLRAKSKKAAS